MEHVLRADAAIRKAQRRRVFAYPSEELQRRERELRGARGAAAGL